MAQQTRFTDLDFKPRRKSGPSLPGTVRRLRLHWVLLAVAGVTSALLLTILSDDAGAWRDDTAQTDSEAPAGQSVRALTLPPRKTDRAERSDSAADTAAADAPASTEESAAEETAAADTVPAAPVPAGNESPQPEQPAVEWSEYQVKNGDSLAAIFSRAGLSPRVVYDLMHSGEPAQALKRIYPGDVLKLQVDDGNLLALNYRVDDSVMLHIERGEDDGLHAEMVSTPLEHRRTHASAVINTSLFAAAKDAGLSDRLIMQLAGIFGWDVDFALDIRKGDSFTVIYEELYRDGKKIRNGDIVAAEFTNQGSSFRALRYTDPDGKTAYYSPDGHSMKKPFLRTPVNFTRVSSNFNPSRYHPILGKRRPHMGTDYAAPRGTPIKASGDGKIILRGRKGGYGNCIVIKHGARYSTLYGHMSRFANGFHTGSHVKQGQIIGYVGMTGLATGPHLHYEFRVNGVHRDPRTVKLPDAKPINAAFRDNFMEETQSLRAQLDVIHRTELALTAGDQQ